MKQTRRLMALDVLRGITVAGMIMVNNPGSWEHIFAPLRHAEWHGLTPTDLVFPFFMFIMGVSTAFSLKRFDYRLSGALAAKIFRRTLVIFLLGLVLDRVGAFVWGCTGAEGLADGLRAAFNADSIRIPGVLQRLAVCYCAAALIASTMSQRAVKWLVWLLLGGYAAVLLTLDGLSFTMDNVVGMVDRALLGENHLYHEHAYGMSLPIDPEGILSTIPSVAHTLLGYLAGRMLLEVRDVREQMLKLMTAGILLTLAGWLLSYGMPLNKKIWSPTFVLTTCGMASGLLGVLIWWVDVKGHRAWSRVFLVFGVNPLLLYVTSGVLAVLAGVWPGEAPYQWLARLTGSPEWASVLYALGFTLLNWAIGYPLWRKRIYVKI
ncbi:MAG: DUF1624 domain-containing protein [Bacteroidales bacterium]|nr:DUF1624 domain-containing protein [Bacteroidales bacterium]